MSSLKSFLLIVVLGYAALVALMYFAQRAIMYFPERIRTAPAAAGLPEAEEVILDTADGERVMAWHVAAARRTSRWCSISTATAARCATGSSASARSPPTAPGWWR